MTDSAASTGKGSRSRCARAEHKTVAVSTRLLSSKCCTTTRTNVPGNIQVDLDALVAGEQGRVGIAND